MIRYGLTLQPDPCSAAYQPYGGGDERALLSTLRSEIDWLVYS